MRRASGERVSSAGERTAKGRDRTASDKAIASPNRLSNLQAMPPSGQALHHHITSHHITSHHITWHHIAPPHHITWPDKPPSTSVQRATRTHTHRPRLPGAQSAGKRPAKKKEQEEETRRMRD
eukprot:2275380-Rhodomonas_salina.1